VDCKSEDMAGTLAGIVNNKAEEQVPVIAGGSALRIPGHSSPPGVLTICFRKHSEQNFIYDPRAFHNHTIRDGGVMWQKAMCCCTESSCCVHSTEHRTKLCN
jgi:hypothetical protein